MEHNRPQLVPFARKWFIDIQVNLTVCKLITGRLETIRQDVEAIKNNQAKFKEDLKTFEQKLERTTESLNLKFDTLNGEVHLAMTRVNTLEDEVSKLAS